MPPVISTMVMPITAMAGNGGLLQDHRRIVHVGEILHEQAGEDDQGQEDGQGDVATNQVEEAVRK